MTDPRVAFHEEVQFCGWADNHTAGPRITFWLPDGELLNFFRRLTMKKGGRSGQRFYMTLVEIDDQDQPVNQEAKRHLEDAMKGGSLSKHAARLCRDEDFRAWIEEIEQFESGVVTEDRAAEWIRARCNVESRAELDHNVGAAQIYHNMIRRPYLDWLNPGGA